MAFAAVTVMTSCSDKKVTRESFIGKWNADYKWEPINGSAPTNPFEGVTITFTINADKIENNTIAPTLMKIIYSVGLST